MNSKNYFLRNGEIYGIEQKDFLIPKVTQVKHFKDWNEAELWSLENSHRYLTTKTGARHALKVLDREALA